MGTTISEKLPRCPYDTVGGLVFLPRMFHKFVSMRRVSFPRLIIKIWGVSSTATALRSCTSRIRT